MPRDERRPADSPEVMPSLPKPRLAPGGACRAARSSAPRLSPRRPASRSSRRPRGARLRWINIERPRAGRPRLARGALRLPPARLRGRLLAQPAPEGRRVRRLPLHRAALPALRQAARPPERGRGRHLRRARLRDHAAQRAAAAARVPVRALPHERGAARAALRQGRRLPALQDRRRLRRRLVPDAAQDGQQARAPRGRGLRGPLAGGRARPLQRQAGDHQLPQDRAPAARRARATSSARQALHRRGPRHLLRRHQRRLRARLGHARELQGGRRGARGDERVGARRTGSTTCCAS